MKLLKKMMFSLSPRSYAVFFDPSAELLAILSEVWEEEAEHTCSFNDYRDAWQAYMPATLCSSDPSFSGKESRWRKKYAKRAVRFFVNTLLPNEEMRKHRKIQDLMKSSDFGKYIIFQARDLSLLDLNQKPWRGQKPIIPNNMPS